MMKKFEKEILNRYKLWQELFEKNMGNNKNSSKYCFTNKDKYFNSPCTCSGCGIGCHGCGAYSS